MTHGIKALTVSNWLQPDPASSIFAQLSQADGSFNPMSGDDWAAQFLGVRLDDRVPEEVRGLFEVARGALAYGYFFYPLFTLAAEQLYRVAEAAVSTKCELLGAPKRLSFQNKIQYLQDRDVISSESYPQWDAIRRLRNKGSHPQGQTILTPGMVVQMLDQIAKRMNTLFV